MNQNVFLLGAGASFDAGIPLLAGFMNDMRTMAYHGRGPRGKLSNSDHELLSGAMKVLELVENYHARVVLDQFDIEQVLSVLQFDASAGRKEAKQSLKIFTSAIARTIEIFCNVRHTGDLNTVQSDGASIYREFWVALLKLFGERMSHMPAILSFNYDLVMERSLFQVCNGTACAPVVGGTSAKGLRIDYKNPKCGSSTFQINRQRWNGPNFTKLDGHQLKCVEYHQDECPEGFMDIPFFKLHGSLNFPKQREKSDRAWSPLEVMAEPEIVPPVFNKADGIFTSKIWGGALQALRGCRNLVICGYSMPTTDTYMSYFLKAALGPNKDLDQIHVFDPVLATPHGDELRNRYARCFSPHFQSRINFNPGDKLSPTAGTFRGLVSTLTKNPDSILSGLFPFRKEHDQPITHELFAARGWTY